MTSLKAPIKTLINTLGTTITLINKSTPTYDPATGTVTAGAETTRTVKADIMPVTRRENLDVEDGDLTVTIPAQNNFTISQFTEVVIGGDRYRALSFKGLYGFNELVAVEMQLRRIGDG